MEKLISRINELSRKSKESQLTQEEQKEQTELRKEYIKRIKSQVRAKLDNIEFTD